MRVQHTAIDGELFGLPDDTEEDLVGTDWHQRAIDNIYDALLDLALLAGEPWHVGNQLTLLAWAPDGSAWRPSPDIMVHPIAGPEPRKEMVARQEGVPTLVIEVASETTWRHDVNTVRGKAAGYLAMGVAEYLVFDPTGEYLGAPCRGWQRLGEGSGADAWEPAADGRYHSRALGISFQPEGVFLRVHDRAGRPVPWREERLRENAAQARELAAQARELAELRAELARLRGQDPPPAPPQSPPR